MVVETAPPAPGCCCILSSFGAKWASRYFNPINQTEIKMASSKRGGKRQGAGRPQGARSRATKAHKATLSELARQHAPTALSALVAIAKKGESESARVAAANSLLDRAYGKPTQSHEHTGKGGAPISTVDLTNVSADDLERLEALFGPLAGGPGDDDEGDQGGEG